MIPLSDHNPTRRFAFVTTGIIIACVAIYFFVQPAGQVLNRSQDTAAEDNKFTFQYAAIPCELQLGRPLTEEEVIATLDSESDGARCESSAGDESEEVFPNKNVWLAVFISMFLHGGLLHLGGNMLFLWIFGNNIEDRLGPFLFLGFYLAAGVAATAGHYLVDPDSTIPIIGASGALAGVMGMYLVLYPHARIHSLLFLGFIVQYMEVGAKWFLGFWFITQFFIGNDSGVAWVAHVAGFAFGVLVGFLVRAIQGAPPQVDVAPPPLRY